LSRARHILNLQDGLAKAAIGFSLIANAASTGGTDITIIQQLQLTERFQLRLDANRGPLY